MKSDGSNGTNCERDPSFITCIQSSVSEMKVIELVLTEQEVNLKRTLQVLEEKRPEKKKVNMYQKLN